MLIRLGIVLIFLTVAGCSSVSGHGESEAWRFQVAAPKHYDVWVEHLRFERSGERHWSHPVGYLGCCWQGPDGPAGVSGRLDLFPDYVALQWFSFAEQKYYQRLIVIPPGWKEKMREPAQVITNIDVRMVPRRTLTFGLAPGGEIVAWMKSQIGNEVELARFQANELDRDPDIYRVNTEEYLEQHGDFLKQNGVPTSGW